MPQLERAPQEADQEGSGGWYAHLWRVVHLGAAPESEAGSFQWLGPFPTTMEKRLMALGYVKAEVSERNPLADVGRRLRGHEFHYSRCICDRDARYCLKLSRGKGIADGRDGLVENNTMAGYLHTHFYSVSGNKFIESCRAYRRS